MAEPSQARSSVPESTPMPPAGAGLPPALPMLLLPEQMLASVPPQDTLSGSGPGAQFWSPVPL